MRWPDQNRLAAFPEQHRACMQQLVLGKALPVAPPHISNAAGLHTIDRWDHALKADARKCLKRPDVWRIGCYTSGRVAPTRHQVERLQGDQLAIAHHLGLGRQRGCQRLDRRVLHPNCAHSVGTLSGSCFCAIGACNGWQRRMLAALSQLLLYRQAAWSAVMACLSPAALRLKASSRSSCVNKADCQDPACSAVSVQEFIGNAQGSAGGNAHRGGLLHKGDGGVEQQQRQDERKVGPVQQRNCDDCCRLHGPASSSRRRIEQRLWPHGKQINIHASAFVAGAGLLLPACMPNSLTLQAAALQIRQVRAYDSHSLDHSPKRVSATHAGPCGAAMHAHEIFMEGRTGGGTAIGLLHQESGFHM